MSKIYLLFKVFLLGLVFILCESRASSGRRNPYNSQEHRQYNNHNRRPRGSSRANHTPHQQRPTIRQLPPSNNLALTIAAAMRRELARRQTLNASASNAKQENQSPEVETSSEVLEVNDCEVDLSDADDCLATSAYVIEDNSPLKIERWMSSEESRKVLEENWRREKNIRKKRTEMLRALHKVAQSIIGRPVRDPNKYTFNH